MKKGPEFVALQDLKIGSEFVVEGTIIGIRKDETRIQVVLDGNPVGVTANLHVDTVVLDLETKSPNFRRRKAKNGKQVRQGC